MKSLISVFAFSCSLLYSNYNFSPQVQLSQSDGEAFAPSLAVDPQGNAVATWSALLPVIGEVVQAATKLYGEAWSPVQNISNLLEASSYPIVHVDANGDAVAIWMAGAPSALRSATKPFNLAWEYPPLNIPSVGQAIEYDLAVNPNDGFSTAVWTETDNNLYTSEKSLAGPAWAARVTLSNTTTVTNFALGIDSAGNVSVAWIDAGTVNYRTKPSAGVWQPTQQVEGLGGNSNVRISVNNAGNAMLIWAGANGVGTSFVPLNQPPTTPEYFLNSNTAAFSDITVGLDNAGNAIAFWTNTVNTPQSSVKIGGQPWTSQTLDLPNRDSAIEINISSCDLTAIVYHTVSGVMIRTGVIGQTFAAPSFVGFGMQDAFPLVQNPCDHAIALLLNTNGAPTDIEATEGFAIAGVSTFSGIQRKNDFGTVSEFENRLKWSTTNPASGYKIFRNGILLATLPGSKNKYVDPQQTRGVPVVYTIALLDDEGNESAPTSITVP